MRHHKTLVSSSLARACLFRAKSAFLFESVAAESADVRFSNRPRLGLTRHNKVS